MTLDHSACESTTPAIAPADNADAERRRLFPRPAHRGGGVLAPLARVGRSVLVLIAAAVAVVSLGATSVADTGGSAAGGPGPEQSHAVARAGAAAASSSAGSWGVATEPSHAYAEEIGSAPQYVLTTLQPGKRFYAYCKAPWPESSKYFQYYAAIPANDFQADPGYRMAWVEGGSMRFTRLMNIPRC